MKKCGKCLLTAKEHASDGCRGRTEPDKGTGLGVFNGIQSFHVASVFKVIWHFSRMANGV
jgi:hypothetical protein